LVDGAGQPSVKHETLELPPLDISTLELPPLDISTLELPPLDTSTLELPPLDIATLELPPLDISTLELPPLDIATLELPPSISPSTRPRQDSVVGPESTHGKRRSLSRRACAPTSGLGPPKGVSIDRLATSL